VAFVARPRSLTVAGAAQELAQGAGIYFRVPLAALVSRLSLAEDLGAGTWNLSPHAIATRRRFDSNRSPLYDRLFQIN